MFSGLEQSRNGDVREGICPQDYACTLSTPSTVTWQGLESDLITWSHRRFWVLAAFVGDDLR